MKTTPILTAVLTTVILGALGTSARAESDQFRTQQEQRQAETHNADRFRDTVTYPFRLVGRTGRTIIRTPVIVAETVKGEREFVNESGFFSRKEEARSDANRASELEQDRMRQHSHDRSGEH